MKIALAREHRKTLEAVIAQARVAAESGAAKALQALAVGAKEAPAHFTKDQIKLRVRLRAHGRQLPLLSGCLERFGEFTMRWCRSA